ncbi:MAG: glycine/betaine ABC transporter substrate-binding protein [Actinomycetes bacterium]|jgi:osmoprotectant transport system substrate-binding protein|nr:glycine/betaine ABC transporter substrate-binding protein [Actinomycetes bacterium]
MEALSKALSKRKQLLLILCALVLVVGLVACSKSNTATTSNGDDTTQTAEKTPVKVGSKDFTENLIVGELYALALEDHGIPVTRTLNLAGSAIPEAQVKGDVDLYPQYTGTGLLSILQLPMETDPQKVYDTVKEQFKEKWNIIWLDMAPANDGQGLVVTKEISDKYGIKTISDFQAHADKIRFASQGEFDHREDGIPRLEEIYGPLKFKSSKIYDNALKYEILKEGKADAAPAYTTEGQLVEPEFVLLEDDKRAWPPYNLAPVVRGEVLEAYPEIADLLNKIDKDLTTEKVTELNYKVAVGGEEYEEVAAAYYDSIKANL